MRDSVLKNSECEFCGKIRKWVSSNEFHGHYCPECIRLNRKSDAECLREIKRARQKANREGNRENELPIM
jgi:phage FluMu protein Com